MDINIYNYVLDTMSFFLECTQRRRIRCKAAAKTCKIGSKEMAQFYDAHQS